MKEYSPKPDLWSKIQQQKDFDLQVKNHAENLPERLPKADLWSAIESELDRKTHIFSLWKYEMIAASIAWILALSGIAYVQFGEKDAETKLITAVKMESPEVNTTDDNPIIEMEADVVAPEQIALEMPNRNAPQKKLTNRETSTPIEFSRSELTDLIIENTFVSELIIPQAHEMEASQTLHQVRVSWGMPDKSKFQTTLGASNPENIGSQQIGRTDQTSNTIKIRLKKK